MKAHDAVRLISITGTGALLLLATACGNSTIGKPSAQSSSGSVTAAYESLISALGSCGRAAGQCAKDAAGDAGALGSCRDQLNACRASAGSDASQALTDAIHTCTDSARDCRKSASNDAGKSGCQDTLRECLSANRPSDHGDDDAGSPASDQGQAIARCVDALHSCVESDMEPMVCAEQMRSCVLAAVPVPSNVTPGGPSTPGARPDAGRDMKAVDAGHPVVRPEAGDLKPVDAGHAGDKGGAHDAGMPEDAGASCMKHLQTCLDAGNTPQDCRAQQQKCGKGQH
jgi:hypothetical protein